MDSRLEETLILYYFTERNKIPWRIKKELYKLTIVDRSAIGFSNGEVLIETEPIEL